jgi:large subunit ribosomal protein L31e
MGKKINNAANAKKEGKKELQPITRKLRINLHKQLHGVQFKKKAPSAVKIVKQIASRNMGTKDVRIDPELNKELWRNGIRNLPNRVDVVLDRKKNEDEEGEEKMYTLVRLAPTFEQSA